METKIKNTIAMKRKNKATAFIGVIIFLFTYSTKTYETGKTTIALNKNATNI